MTCFYMILWIHPLLFFQTAFSTPRRLLRRLPFYTCRRSGVAGKEAAYFLVYSVEQTVNELAEAGIECEPIRVDGYTGKKMTFFHNPDGLPLELHE